MIKTYKYKLYCSKKNNDLNTNTKICGNIYNHCIALTRRYYKMYGTYLNKFDLQKHITKLKKLEKYSFWNKVGSQSVQDVTDRIDRAYRAFFNNCKKKVKTRKVSPPSFKKAQTYPSFTLKQAGYKILPQNKIKINKKIYKYFKSRDFEGNIKCITIKKDNLGDWYVFFVCDIGNGLDLPKSISMTGKTAGFDFGCTTFLTQNNGTKIQSPLFFEKGRKDISKANQKLSKKVGGSNNFKASKLRLARKHRKIANQRQDFHFKLANSLLREYDTIILETLDLASMKKDHGKKINDLGFSSFVSVLENKALEYGKTIYHIDKWFASSKTCSGCGYKYDALGKHERTWECPRCGSYHDRDHNAAINIFEEGMKILKGDGASSSIERRESISLGNCQDALAIA